MRRSLAFFRPGSGTFFTLIYARVNHQTGQLSMINAGHRLPLSLAPTDLSRSSCFRKGTWLELSKMNSLGCKTDPQFR